MISTQNEESNNIYDYSDYHEQWSNIKINLIQNSWDKDSYEDNTENKYLEEYIIVLDNLVKRIKKQFIDFFAN